MGVENALGSSPRRVGPVAHDVISRTAGTASRRPDWVRLGWRVGRGALMMAVAVAVWAPAAWAGGTRARAAPDTGLRTLPASRVVLGPVDPAEPLHAVVGLEEPDVGGLERLIASGMTVSPATFDARFAPRASRVLAALGQLDRAGLRATWTPGSLVIDATGPAGAVERAFSVHLNRYQGHGAAYQAPTGPPRFTGSLRGLASSLGGVDTSRHVTDDTQSLEAQPAPGPGSAGCGPGPSGGYTPDQVLGAYNFEPLRRGGLTGAGQTVVFVETDSYQEADLACFQRQFGGPPFEVAQAPQRWGTPDTSEHAEADLDLEIVHAIAPDAHLVVYYADSNPDHVASAAAAAVQAYPHGILSVSLGGCEWAAQNKDGTARPSSDETTWHAALRRLAATGGSAFIASGDSGAFMCGSQVTESDGQTAPTVSSPADDPYATAVGGTALFVGRDDTYAGEATWGSPFQQVGSGGGVSAVWDRPSYQEGPGVSNPYSDGGREVPDVAALGDPETGWDIYSQGWSPIGGTSAAAPAWAALMALTDESAAGFGLPPVGFANPALYQFGRYPGRQPARPFNDVTEGSNLYYVATRGWDYGTGWGSPNAAGIVDDFLAYQRAKK